VSGSTQTSTTTAEGSREAALRATAVAYAHAFLTGTVLDFVDLQSPPCRTKAKAKPTPSQIAAATKELQKVRDAVSRMTGLSAAQVQSKISGVSVRDVGTSTGEAEVRYDLPVTATGNGNWVTYKLVDGEWKVHDCILPIGGNVSHSP